jgi:L-rhamnose mutarotase
MKREVQPEGQDSIEGTDEAARFCDPVTDRSARRLQAIPRERPPEILTDPQRNIFCNHSIYFWDGFLSYFEYTGSPTLLWLMAADPKTQAWWAIMKPMQEPLDTRAEGEWWAQMEEVFHMDWTGEPWRNSKNSTERSGTMKRYRTILLPATALVFASLLSAQTEWENPVKALLREGKPVVGATITVASPDVAAHAANMGFDFLWIEMEHSPITLETARNMILATRGLKAMPFIRVPVNEVWTAKRALDAGARRDFPFTSTPSWRGRRWMRKYPPLGRRGFGPGLGVVPPGWRRAVMRSSRTRTQGDPSLNRRRRSRISRRSHPFPAST